MMLGTQKEVTIIHVFSCVCQGYTVRGHDHSCVFLCLPGLYSQRSRSFMCFLVSARAIQSEVTIIHVFSCVCQGYTVRGQDHSCVFLCLPGLYSQRSRSFMCFLVFARAIQSEVTIIHVFSCVCQGYTVRGQDHSCVFLCLPGLYSQRSRSFMCFLVSARAIQSEVTIIHVFSCVCQGYTVRGQDHSCVSLCLPGLYGQANVRDVRGVLLFPGLRQHDGGLLEQEHVCEARGQRGRMSRVSLGHAQER